MNAIPGSRSAKVIYTGSEQGHMNELFLLAREIYSCRLNKMFSFEFPSWYHLPQTPEEDQRIEWLKCCGGNNQDEDTNQSKSW